MAFKSTVFFFGTRSYSVAAYLENFKQNKCIEFDCQKWFTFNVIAGIYCLNECPNKTRLR